MRRTKAQGLHPATQMAAQALSNYFNPGDPAGVVRFEVPSPLDSPWDNVPIDPFPQVLASAKLYDFRDDNDLTNVWQNIKDNEGSTVAALLDRKGGAARFKCGTREGRSFNKFETINHTFAFEPGKQTWAEFRVSNDQGRPQTGTLLNLGFGDGYNIDNTRPDNLIQVNIAFGNYYQIEIHTDGALTYVETMTEEFYLEDGEMYNLGMHFEPSSETPGEHTLLFFANSELVFAQPGLVLPTEPMGVLVGAESHEDEVTLEHVFVIQED